MDFAKLRDTGASAEARRSSGSCNASVGLNPIRAGMGLATDGVAAFDLFCLFLSAVRPH